jgi:RNA polymerase sigma-70 factor (ECF subfamily)
MERIAWLHSFSFALLASPGDDLAAAERELITGAGELGMDPLTLMAGCCGATDLPGLPDAPLVVAVRRPLLAAESFEVLYHRYFSRLVDGAFPRWGVDYHTGEDLAEDLFLNLWAGRFDGYDPQRPFRPYFYRTAHNAANTWRRRRRPFSVAELCDPADDTSDVVFDEACLHELEDDFACALARLPEPLREVLQRSCCGQRLQEIARALQVPYGTAGTWLHAARGELRRLLGRGGC